MVVHHIPAQPFHQPVERQGCLPLEESVGLPFAPHPEHHIGALQIAVHHLRDDLHIVLQVRINGNSGIGPGRRPLQSGPQGLLVSYVVGQLQALDVRTGGGKSRYQLPGTVFAPIVDIEENGLLHLAGGAEPVQHRRQA